MRKRKEKMRWSVVCTGRLELTDTPSTRFSSLQDSHFLRSLVKFFESSSCLLTFSSVIPLPFGFVDREKKESVLSDKKSRRHSVCCVRCPFVWQKEWCYRENSSLFRKFLSPHSFSRGLVWVTNKVLSLLSLSSSLHQSRRRGLLLQDLFLFFLSTVFLLWIHVVSFHTYPSLIYSQLATLATFCIWNLLSGEREKLCVKRKVREANQLCYFSLCLPSQCSIPSFTTGWPVWREISWKH